MSGSLYATLNRLYGTPRSAGELLDLAAPKRQRLLDTRLLPSALSHDALSASSTVSALRVAVVGGGFAGLTAAWYLQQCGVGVAVFEASDRLGGRVHTDSDFIAGKVVERGAELIGSNHPMWIELAQLVGLNLVEISHDEDYENDGLAVRIRFGDHDLTVDERKQLLTDMTPVLDAIGQDAKDINQEKPWLSPNADAFDRMTVAARLDQIVGPESSILRTALDFMLGNDNCAPPGQQSYLGLLSLVSAGRMGDDAEGLRGYWDATETHRCGGGNQQLASELAGPLTDVRLSTPVTKILINDDNIGITWGDGGDVGGEEAFDYVVLATAPAVWPTIECPRYGWIPDEYTMAHGPAVKFLSAFDTPFWNDQKLAPSAKWDKVGSIWEGTDQQAADQPGFCLSVYSGGDYVLTETDYPSLLAEIYPGYAPTATAFVDWPNIDWVRTGYSVPAPTQVTDKGRSLVTPYGERMYFAGEHTCVPYFGYMEGALQSGARAARDLIAEVCPDAVQ